MTDHRDTQNDGTIYPEITNEAVQKLFETKAKEILFAFEDEMLAIEKEIKEEEEKYGKTQ